LGASGRPIARAPLLPSSVCTSLSDGQLQSEIPHPACVSGGLPGMHSKGNEVLVSAVDGTTCP